MGGALRQRSGESTPPKPKKKMSQSQSQAWTWLDDVEKDVYTVTTVLSPSMEMKSIRSEGKEEAPGPSFSQVFILLNQFRLSDLDASLNKQGTFKELSTCFVHELPFEFPIERFDLQSKYISCKTDTRPDCLLWVKGRVENFCIETQNVGMHLGAQLHRSTLNWKATEEMLLKMKLTMCVKRRPFPKTG